METLEAFAKRLKGAKVVFLDDQGEKLFDAYLLEKLRTEEVLRYRVEPNPVDKPGRPVVAKIVAIDGSEAAGLKVGTGTTPGTIPFRLNKDAYTKDEIPQILDLMIGGVSTAESIVRNCYVPRIEVKGSGVVRRNGKVVYD